MVDVVLSREQGWCQTVDESYHREGLSASNSSGVTGRVSADQSAVGVLSFSGITLALGRGLRTGVKECL